MVEERAQRRLAAILVADVVGYSRLMGADEVGTLAALTAHLEELIEPCISKHRGRVVKTTGMGYSPTVRSGLSFYNLTLLPAASHLAG